MTACEPLGWGEGGYGQEPWGGELGLSPGGPIPEQSPFDVYCVGPCGPISLLITYDEVGEELGTGGDGTQIGIDPSTFDTVLRSGGGYPTATAWLEIDKGVPSTFTLDLTFCCPSLPPNFSSVDQRHVAVLVTDPSGPCAGLLFSKIGIAYFGGAHHDGDGRLQLDTALQLLPNSQTFVEEGVYWTLRLASDHVTKTTYIYLTETAELPLVGHQLRFILPMIPSSLLHTVPAERTMLSVAGTLVAPTVLKIASVCLGSGFLIPNLPPRALPGRDQRVRTCSIVELDGSASYDPEGATLQYKWQLIGAPSGSVTVFEGVDGVAPPLPVPTGFTNRLYSSQLEQLESEVPIVVGVLGDILLLRGVPYVLMGKGVDPNLGFYVAVDGYVLPDNLPMAAFQLLRQSTISNRTSAKPTFYPDVPGLYKFQLTVSDGQLSSFPETTVLNVVESNVPRGIIPDLHFLWDHLSDFWKLVEGKERIDVFWGAMAQVAASELLTLWQFDYNKSLRDIQRTFQRRWLHYDLLVKEPLPETTSARMLLGGLRSLPIPSNVTSFADQTGRTLALQLGDRVATVALPVISTAAPFVNVQKILQDSLRVVDKRFSVASFTNSAGDRFLRVDAPFSFELLATSTCTLFEAGVSGLLSGQGHALGSKVYQVDQSLKDYALKEDDLLVIDGLGYRILSVTSAATDFEPLTRIILKDPLSSLGNSAWSIPSLVTSRELDFYNGLFCAGDTVTFELIEDEEVTLRSTTVIGVAEGRKDILAFDPTSLAWYTSTSSTYLTQLRRRTYVPIADTIADIPRLQERIKSDDDTCVLRRNIDYFFERLRGFQVIRFVTSEQGPDVWEHSEPPDRLWAETTYLDNRPTIENNFGRVAGFTIEDLAQLPDTVDYLSAVRGLWYSYLRGPALENLRVGTQILLGLPFAEERGRIVEIRNDYSTVQGRILVQDVAHPEYTRSYVYPPELGLEVNPATGAPYVEGDLVEQFAPLVKGVEVEDYVKNPRWFEGYLNQGCFFEVEKFFKFLVRVDSNTFNLSALLFAQSFIRRIKPTYTMALYVVVAEVDYAEVSPVDDVSSKGTLYLHDGALTQLNDISSMGTATMSDEPSPGGGWQSQSDRAKWEPLSSEQTLPVIWGGDRKLLSPEDSIIAKMSIQALAPFTPTSDSIFSLDSEVWQGPCVAFGKAGIVYVPYTDGLRVGDVLTYNNVNPLVIQQVQISLMGYLLDEARYYLDLWVDGVLELSELFIPTDGLTYQETLSITPITVNTGSTVEVRVRASADPGTSMTWKSLLVQLGTSIGWRFGQLPVPTLPADTYTVFRLM